MGGGCGDSAVADRVVAVAAGRGAKPSPAGGAAGLSGRVPVCRREPNGGLDLPVLSVGCSELPVLLSIPGPGVGGGGRRHLLLSGTGFRKGKASSFTFSSRKSGLIQQSPKSQLRSAQPLRAAPAFWKDQC